MVLQGDKHLQEKNLHQEDPERHRSREILTVQLEKWTSYHQYGEKQKVQIAITVETQFNSILLLNEIVLESWTVKVCGAEEDVNKGKNNKKGVDLVHDWKLKLWPKPKLIEKQIT